ncbi:MAG: ADP-ribose pyrophosphatase [Flavobacteriaceae bacterium]|nr:MAG: ADP-ribose pyrophosphatase [Flavobacteriaceae bacterium]
MNSIIYKGDWIIKGSKVTYENPWIKIKHHDVLTPGGTAGIYGEVHFKNLAIGILPIDRNGFTWRVGQFRFPLNAYSWEIPEGGGPHDIDPLESAKRELVEEVGYTAQTWTPLLEMHLSNSVSDEKAIVFLAEDLTEGVSQPEDTENLTVEKIHFSELYQQVMDGIITDSISVAAVLKLSILRPKLLKM